VVPAMVERQLWGKFQTSPVCVESSTLGQDFMAPAFCGQDFLSVKLNDCNAQKATFMAFGTKIVWMKLKLW